VIGKYLERRDEKLARLGAAAVGGHCHKMALPAAFIAAATVSIAARRLSIRPFDVRRFDLETKTNFNGSFCHQIARGANKPGQHAQFVGRMSVA
jgi:hypothetical protein